MECSGLPESGIETHWKGRYACERICGEKYDCGVHSCEEVSGPDSCVDVPRLWNFVGQEGGKSVVKGARETGVFAEVVGRMRLGSKKFMTCSIPVISIIPTRTCKSSKIGANCQLCHPHPLSALPCLTSPLLITHCACGQTPLSAITSAPARTKCTDPIPTCSSPCPRSRPCGHACPLPCHTGECPPCHAEVVRPCRCGESVLVIGCEELAARQRAGEGEMTCERVCKALRK